MTNFWFLSAILLLLAILFVVVPFVRYRPDRRALADSEIRKQKNIDVYQQSLAELERDRADELLDAEAYEKLQTELQRSFLRDMEDEEAVSRQFTGKGSPLVPALCLIFVCAFSYSLYVVIGSARDLSLPVLLDDIAGAETEEQQIAALGMLADFLQRRFERRPDDIQNGYMLGTLYLQLENYDAAVRTFAALVAQMEPNRDMATVLGQLAQATFLQAGSEMTPAVEEIVGRALALNPNESAVMSLLAIDAFIREDYVAALGYWRRQLQQMNPGSREAASLRQRVTLMEQMLSQSEPAAAVGGASVSLVIDLDESMRGFVNDDMRLFVFARNSDSPMPMPIAAQNLAVPEFPFEITLDDSMAMMDNLSLSTAQNVIVGARLSRSGQATAQPGDIQALSAPFALREQTEPVILTIDEIVQ